MSAWTEGFQAQQGGTPIDANPYRALTERWYSWRAGWFFLGSNPEPR